MTAKAWKTALFTEDLPAIAKTVWSSIDRRYKTAFFTALAVNSLVFLVFIVQQPMHNHGILSRLLYTSPYEQWPSGRWFSVVIFRIFNSSNLMVVLPLVTIVLHVLGGILAVTLWDRRASATSLTAGALLVSLYPAVMTSFNFSFVGPIFSAPHLLAPLALLAASSFAIRHISIGALVVCLMMATYQPGLSIISTIFAAYVLIKVVEECKSRKDLFSIAIKDLAPRAVAVAAGGLLYRASLPLFGIAPSQTTSTISLVDVPAKFMLTAKKSFAYLFLTQPELLSTVKTTLLAVLVLALFTLYYLACRGSDSPGFTSLTLFLLSAFAVCLVMATKAMYLVSTNENFWTYRYNHALGYLYMFGFFVLLKYWRVGLYRNIVYLVFLFVVIRYAYADIGRQQVILRAQDHYLAIANRVLYRIEHLPDVDLEKEYRVVRIGRFSNFQHDQLKAHGHAYDKGGDVHLDSELSPIWGPGDIFNYLGSKVKLQGYMNSNFIRDREEATKLVAGRSPWPSEDSVFVHEDMIIIYMK